MASSRLILLVTLMMCLVYHCMGVPGEYEDADVNEEDVKEIAKWAALEIDMQIQEERRLIMIQLVKAAKQVVSGTKYAVTLELAPTNCFWATNQNPSCQPLPDQPSRMCEASIWDRPWLGHGERHLLSYHCDNTNNQ